MKLRFRGESTHKVDAKGRVSVPSDFRKVLIKGDYREDAEDGSLLIAITGMRGQECIECYTLEGMEELEDRILAIEDDVDQQTLLDEVVAASRDRVLDENGRMILSPDMRQALKISDKALFVGKIDMFQIWNPETYAERRAKVAEERQNRPRELDPYRHLARRTRRPSQE